MDNLGFIIDAEAQNENVQENEDVTELRLRINVSQNENSKQEDEKKEEKIKEASRMKVWLREKKLAVRYAAYVVLNLAVFAYFFAALSFWYNRDIVRKWEFCNGFGMLLILMSIIYFFLLYFVIVKRFFGKAIIKLIFEPIDKIYTKLWKIRYVRWGFNALLIVALILFLIFDTEDSRDRLKSLIGLAFLLVFGYVFSRNRNKIYWRPVVWGIVLQFLMGLLTIRWSVGRDVFQCVGDKVATFLGYSEAGSKFVYSELLIEDTSVFAFKALSVIYFFSLIIEVLFYWGAMQWVCLKLGWCLHVTMGTTVCESMIAAANIFLGMSESPLLIRPYIPDLTKSEMHAIMTSGFATVSGTVLKAYILFGANAAHLITASVMSAPAALCYAKLFYPETGKSNTAVYNLRVAKSSESSVLDAAAKGASAAIVLVLTIIANLIGFVSLIAFINGIIGWLGMLVGFDFLSLEWFFGKIFVPLSWIMGMIFVWGVPWEECEIVGSLIGLKTIVNEFIAYQKMGEYIKQGLLSSRGEAIATYALCGFTNPSSIGIMVGALSAMAPSRRSEVAEVAIRGLIAGCAVCFMTACIAGLLIPPGAFDHQNSAEIINTTVEYILKGEMY